MNQARVLRLLLLTVLTSVLAAVLIVMVSRSTWHVPLLSAARPAVARPLAPVEVTAPDLALPGSTLAADGGDADPVLVGAGDIAGCDFEGDETTASTPLLLGLVYGLLIFLLAYAVVLPVVNPLLRNSWLAPLIAQNMVFGVCVGGFYTMLRPRPYDMG